MNAEKVSIILETMSFFFIGFDYGKHRIENFETNMIDKINHVWRINFINEIKNLIKKPIINAVFWPSLYVILYPAQQFIYNKYSLLLGDTSFEIIMRLIILFFIAPLLFVFLLLGITIFLQWYMKITLGILIKILDYDVEYYMLMIGVLLFITSKGIALMI